MRIIKLGSNKEKETITTCYKCKTKFAYKRCDVKSDARDGNYVNCPECQAFINDK